MVFSSLLFLFSFFPFVLLGNYSWRNRTWQNILLFIASLYFYAWGEKEKVFVLLLSILLNYFIGLKIGKAVLSSKKNLALTLGVIVNLGVLVYFKYTAFIIENINFLLTKLDLTLITGIKYEKLPIGISFYTFQSISYLFDVRRKQVEAQKSFMKLGLYIAFFPQLIAGPIVRYKEIAEQLEKRKHSVNLFREGIERFVIGLAKKILIANPIALYVDEIFALEPSELSLALCWVATLGYALQIYYDFSGYSDMAIGLGKMFGFRLPENFNYPYIARSIREFWTRWHITLSVWFRDYLYIPLGGNREGELKTIRNLIVVFLITGLWHGASWSFILWGLFHGFFMILERFFLLRLLKRIPPIISNVYVLLVVLFAWVFFRIEDFGTALYIQKTMLNLTTNYTAYSVFYFLNNYSLFITLIAILGAIPLFLKVRELKYYSMLSKMKEPVIIILFILCILEMANETYSPFIYFRF